MLQNGKSPCPDSYRVPNIREVTLLHLLADDINWWGGSSMETNASRIYTSSYYSMGILGNGENGYGGSVPRISWNTTSFRYGSNGNINLDGDKSRWIRCVRDWNPATDE